MSPRVLLKRTRHMSLPQEQIFELVAFLKTSWPDTEQGWLLILHPHPITSSNLHSSSVFSNSIHPRPLKSPAFASLSTSRPSLRSAQRTRPVLTQNESLSSFCDTPLECQYADIFLPIRISPALLSSLLRRSRTRLGNLRLAFSTGFLESYYSRSSSTINRVGG